MCQPYGLYKYIHTYIQICDEKKTAAFMTHEGQNYTYAVQYTCDTALL